jgi:hypothetical protein
MDASSNVEAPAAASLEQALARAEREADAAIKAAGALVAALKRYRAAAATGSLRDLGTTLDTAEQALTTLRQQVANTRDSWDFDEDRYFADGSFTRELLAAAKAANLSLFEQDDRLYAYPALLRVLGSERTVLVDRTRERRLRPSVLVQHLKDLQRKPPRFKSADFLESLYAAYQVLYQRRTGGTGKLQGSGPVEKLLDLYDLFTLLPGQAREYSKPEFARDLYLLDRSGTTVTKSGATLELPASTGTRSSSGLVRVVTEDGQEKVYYGITFTTPEER